MKPIIFLDIDGVVNTQDGLDYSLRHKGETHDKRGLSHFCPKSCEHVSKLIEHYQADVVLYSPWADEFKSLDETNKFFKSRGLNWNVVDKTSGLITDWFTKNGTPEKYVAITTDDTLLDIIPGHSVVTEDMHGFADRKIYRKAMNILKKEAEVVVVKAKQKDTNLF